MPANSPARLPYSASAVTKSDTTKLQNVLGLYVGTGGDVVVHTARGLEKEEDTGTAPTSVTFKNVPSGGYIHCGIGRVLAATTASDIVALR